MPKASRLPAVVSGSALVGVCVWVFASAGPRPSTARAEPPDAPPATGLKVLTAAGGKIGLQTTGAEATFVLALQNTATKPAEGVRLSAGPLVRRDGLPGPASRPAGQGAAPLPPPADSLPSSVRIDGQAGEAQQKVIPAGGAVSFSVKCELPAEAAYQGWIAVAVGDRADVYQLDVTRTAPPGFRLAGPEQKEQKEATFGVTSRDARLALVLEPLPGQPEVADLTVSAEPLRREDAGAAGPGSATAPAAHAAAAGAKVAAVQVGVRPTEATYVAVDLSGLEAATYATALRLSYGGRVQRIPFKVRRADRRNDLRLVGSTTVPSDGGPLFGGSAELTVTVETTDGRPPDAYLPRPLVNLERTDPAGHTSTYSSTRPWRLVPEPAGPPTPGQPPPPRVTYALCLDDLPAGAYRGRVAVSGPNSVESYMDFTIRVRHNVLWAVAVTFFGVLLAYLALKYVRVGRRKLQNLAAVADARKRVADVIDEEGVRSRLAERLSALQDRVKDLQGTDQAAVDRELQDVLARVDVYRRATAAREAVRQILDGFVQGGADEQIRVEIETDVDLKFEAVTAALKDVAADPKPPAAELDALADEARARMLQSVARRLRRRLDAVARQTPALGAAAKAAAADLDKFLADLPAAKVKNPAVLEEAAESYRDVCTAQYRWLVDLAEAEQSAVDPPGPTAFGAAERQQAAARRAADAAGQEWRLDEFQKKLAAARAAYQQLVVAQLAALVGENAPRPWLVDAAAWKAAAAARKDLAGKLGSLAEARGRAAAAADDDDRTYRAVAAEYLVLVARLARARLAALLDLVPAFAAEAPALMLAVVTDAGAFAALDGLGWLPDAASDAAVRDATARAVATVLTAASAQLRKAFDEYLKAQPPAAAAAAAVGEPALALAAVAGHLKATSDRLGTVLPSDYGLDDVRRLASAERSLDETFLSLHKVLVPKPTPAAMAAVPAITVVGGFAGDRGTGGWLRARHSAEPFAVVLPRQAFSADAVGSAAAPTTDDRPADYYRRRLAWADEVMAGIVLVVAVAGSLTTLYWDKLTFGSPQDYIAAFLWGLGTNVAATGFAAFAGMMGVLPAPSVPGAAPPPKPA